MKRTAWIILLRSLIAVVMLSAILPSMDSEGHGVYAQATGQDVFAELSSWEREKNGPASPIPYRSLEQLLRRKLGPTSLLLPGKPPGLNPPQGKVSEMAPFFRTLIVPGLEPPGWSLPVEAEFLSQPASGGKAAPLLSPPPRPLPLIAQDDVTVTGPTNITNCVPFTYAIIVTNNDAVDATGVIVTSSMPGGFIPTQRVFNVGVIAAGETITRSAVFTPGCNAVSGSGQNVTVVSQDGAGDITVYKDFTVQGPNLQLKISPVPAGVTCGDKVTRYITVTNVSAVTAEAVRIGARFAYNMDLEYVSDVPTRCIYLSGRDYVYWELADLLPGQSAIYSAVVQYKRASGGICSDNLRQVRVSAFWGCGLPDGDPSTGCCAFGASECGESRCSDPASPVEWRSSPSDSQTSGPEPMPDLVIASVQPLSPTCDTIIITVTNQSHGDDTGPLPAGTTITAYVGIDAANFYTLTKTLAGALLPGASTTLVRTGITDTYADGTHSITATLEPICECDGENNGYGPQAFEINCSSGATMAVEVGACNQIVTATGHFTGVTPYTYTWYYGDGTNSGLLATGETVIIATHQYIQCGNYAITLITTDSVGSIFSDTYGFHVNQPPVAAIGAITPHCDMSVDYANTTTDCDINSPGYTEGLTFTWLLYGSSGLLDSTTVVNDPAAYPMPDMSTPPGVITQRGTYTITLVVTDHQGCAHSVTRDFYLDGPPPPIAYSLESPLCVNQEGTFTITAVSGVTYTLDFGDGSPTETIVGTGADETRTHGYSNAGAYTTIVTAATGCTIATTAVVEVFEPPPPIAYSLESPLCVNQKGTFTITAVAGVTYTLDFGDGSPTKTIVGTGADETRTHSYSNAGAYTTIVTAATGCGVTIATAVVEVFEPLPPIAYSLESPLCVNQEGAFTITAVSGVTYTLDFGDGSPTETIVGTGADETRTHGYSNAGAYTSIVTAATGCGITHTSQVVVVSPTPTGFITGPLAVCIDQTSITHTFSNSYAAYDWTVSGGTLVGSATNPSVTWNAPSTGGSVWLTVVVTNAAGCADTFGQAVLVSGFPMGAINGPTAVCAYQADVVHSFAAGYMDYGWQVQGGTIVSGATSSAVTWSAPFTSGTVTVTVVVTGAAACVETFSQTVTVVEAPSPGLVISPTMAAVHETISFSDAGTGGVAWEWNFGDGTVVTTAITATSHSYTIGGLYTVGLTSTAASGCLSTAWGTVMVVEPIGFGSCYLPVIFNSHPSQADLIVQDVRVDPADPAAGQLATIYAIIINQGNGVANDFQVDLYIDPIASPAVNRIWPDTCPGGAPPADCYGLVWSVPTLGPGQSVTLDSNNYDSLYSHWEGRFATPGTHQVYVLADSYGAPQPYGAVLEKDETNNLYGPVAVHVSANTALLFSDFLVFPHPQARAIYP